MALGGLKWRSLMSPLFLRPGVNDATATPLNLKLSTIRRLTRCLRVAC